MTPALTLLALMLLPGMGGHRLPSGTTPPRDMDTLAVHLASRVSAGGPDAEAALAYALRASGYSVLTDDGTVSFPLAATNGPLVGWWELRAMADLARAGMVIPARDVYALLAELGEAVADPNGGRRLLDALRVAATGDDSATRFFAGFVLALTPEMDRRAEAVRGDGDPEDELTSLQASLILQRLAHEMGALAPDPAGGMSRLQAPGAGVSLFHLASRDVGRRAFLPRRGGLAAGSLRHGPAVGCHPEGDARNMTVFLAGPLGGVLTGDERATLRSFVFGQVLKDILQVRGWVMNRLLAANLALAYGKILYLARNMDVRIEMEPDTPLKRTQNARPGETRTLTATVRYRTKDLEAVNCVRAYLNMLSLDASIPEDGPAPGVVLEWKLVKGQGVVGLGDAEHRMQDAGVGTREIRSQVHSTTDEAGRARMPAIGTPQPNFRPATSAPVDKEFSVRVNMQLEPPTIRSAMGDGVGLLLGGGALATLPAKLVLKTRWISSPTYTFPVIDWSPGYLVRGTYWDAYRITGVICRLDRPFTLTADGGSITLIRGTFTMRPASASGGSWTFAGSMEGMPVTAAGTYTVEESATETPVIRMQPGLWFVTTPVVGRLPLGEDGDHLDHPELLRLTLARNECSG